VRRRQIVHAFAAGLVAAVLASIAGCQAAAPTGLAGREFLSVAITDAGAPFELVAGTRIRIGFTSTDLTASAGCNTFGATYRLDGGRLVVGEGASTAMGCDAALSDQDQRLFRFVGSKPAAILAGTDLTLDNGQTIMRLVDRAIAEPDLNLVGPTWTVTSVIAGDAVSSVPAGAMATLLFREDGSVDVNAGCNDGRGSWTLDGSSLSFRDVFLTKMACDGPAGSLERAVLAVLNGGTLQVSIRATVLTLQAGARGLQLTGS
jgi:heat shock protein HslJ